MPLEGIDEDGLPKNPDLQLMQWRFLLTAETADIDKDAIWESLLQAIKENGEVVTHCTRALWYSTIVPRYGPFLCVTVC